MQFWTRLRLILIFLSKKIKNMKKSVKSGTKLLTDLAYNLINLLFHSYDDKINP